MWLDFPLNGVRLLRNSKSARILILISAVLVIAQWGYMLYKVHPQPGAIPLHYTIAFGIDRIGPWYSAYILPVSGVCILIFNGILSVFFVEHQRVLSFLLLAAGLFTELIFLTSAILTFRTLAPYTPL